MNQRIRELSYEAQRYALNNTTGPDLAGLNELWQEKFAELIVRECMSNLYLHGYDDAAKCLQDIHFGIEDPV